MSNEMLEEENKVHNKNKSYIRDNVLKIALPVLLELFLSTLFGMIDMMMLGRINNPKEAAASIAAVGITNQPLFIGLSLVQALNVGGTAMVARYMGAKKEDRIDSVLKHVVLLSQVMLTIPIFLIGMFFTDNIMKFLGAQSDAISVGKVYFKVIMIGFIFQSFNMSLTAILRGMGDTKSPMWVNIKANSLNVLGNAILIYGLFRFPRLGITGAGISTAISHVFASILMIKYMMKNEIFNFGFRNSFKFNKDIMYNLVKIGVPASLEQVAFRIGIIMFVKIVTSLGTVTYATHQICLNITGLSFTPGKAFGIAASSLVGSSIGSDDLDEAEKYMKECRKFGCIISSFMAVVFFFFGSNIASLYTKDPRIIKKASEVLKIIALVQPFQSSQLVLAGGMRGAGDTVYPLLAMFFGVLVVRVIFAHIFVNILGYRLIGAWLAMLFDQFIRWIVIYFRYRTGKWKYISIR